VVRPEAGEGVGRVAVLPGWGKRTLPTLNRDGRCVAVLGDDRRLQIWKLIGSRAELLIKESDWK
jgi:hypothetical protein